MDWNTIGQFISTVGFPIAAASAMFWQNGKFQKTLEDISKTMAILTERIKDIETHLHKEETKKDGDV